MLIDTDARKVTFKAEETLTLDNLWGLVMWLDPIEEPQSALKAKPEVYKPLTAQYVASETNHMVDYLVVQLQNGNWICSCPDFAYHRDGSGDVCKHIRFALKWG